MCMVDWRLGKLIRSNFLGDFLISLTAIPTNPARVGLMISVQPAGGTPPDASALVQDTNGNVLLVIPSQQSPYLMTVQTHGDLVYNKRLIVTPSGTISCAVMEFLMPVEYTAAALEQFNSEYAEWLKQNYP